ncbi:ABC transporter permease [Sinomonas sp. JGH33]|uniref:Autoinducer 2 import system permease protein LsrD n=1 Tax=Sinomonas terricola TaxID=3110330 RepID=A0ABU5TB95_9MICC|nr:ABC transporter permease [Sinomonas sp. JGH33]MEA5456764.1 ABC transporter permease [Sinomonas sp. JGH33]
MTPHATQQAPSDREPRLALPLEEQATRRRLADNQPTTRWGRLKDDIYYLRGRGALEITGIYLVILAAAIVFSILNPAFPFLSQSNLSGVLTQSIPVLGILAIGAGVLMVAGEFDLSIGAAIGFTAIVFIRMSNNVPWPLALAATIVCGVGIALINGLVVVITRIPSFIATLGLSFFWTGASIYVNGVTPAIFLPGVKDETMKMVFAGDFGYFHSQLLWLLGIGTVAWALLHRHRLGNKIYAVGGNRAAAAAVSIKPNRVKLQAFAILGITTSIAGVLIAVRTSTMQPATTEDYTLLAVAAAVVGGCSLTGGRGTIIGMIVGAALIQTIQNVLILGNAPGFYVQLFVGVCIVVAAVFNKLMEGKAT